MITRTRRIYDRLSRPLGTPPRVTFVQPDEDRPGLTRSSLSLDVGAWEEFGRPDQLTVTIQPGDHLNRGITELVAQAPVSADLDA